MGWDKRGYYYRARKVDGFVVREYIGTGEVASLVAQMDELDREKRIADLTDERAKQEKMNALDWHLDELTELTELLACAALLAGGYRRHKRGEWRKKRGGHQETA